jgi:outer membrane lipoprotein-sorting protein
MIAGAIAELRIWLDQYDCAPRGFEITRAGGCVVVRVEFSEEGMAKAFEREFAR